MILSDTELHALCINNQLHDPYTPELVNPASIDVRLGADILVELKSNQGDMEKLSIASATAEAPWLLAPGEFILASTIERFNVPNYLAAQFKLKSSRAREGLEHLLAGYIDPGFHNSTLTLELVNVRRHSCVPLWPGMKIGQVVYYQMSQVPNRDYATVGNYNNCPTVAASKGHL